MPIARRTLAAFAASTAIAPSAVARADPEAPADLDGILRPYLARFGLPALAAAVVQEGRIVADGAVGTRRAGTDAPVTRDDRFHIGSDTKAMTALLAAILVEKGRLQWETTVGDALPDIGPGLHPEFRAITLKQLLSHTSGIPSDNDETAKLLLASFGRDSENLDETRRWLVSQIGTHPPRTQPGSAFAYSNMGYVTAGAMIERLAETTWEEMISERVFGPLLLTTAGLGPQASLGRVDAPLGHLPLPSGALKPILAGPQGDNPAVLGPAGTAHMSVRDFARWAGWNAGEGKRGPELVSAGMSRQLHAQVIEMHRPDAPPGTPPSGGYGLGWGMVKLDFSAEPFLLHTGSNGMNLAMVFVQPARDFAMVLMTNVGGEKADAGLKDAAAALYGRFGPAR